MKLLITGACGQLGKEWVIFCEKKGIDFQAYCSEELDITNISELRSIVEKDKPSAFINCAAYTNVDKAEEEKDLAFKVNAYALKEISNTCKLKNIKLVHYSTDYVFNGSHEDKESTPEGYSEEHETSPKNVYGLSKQGGEEIIRKSDCEYLILRVSWLCGEYGNNFVKTMLRLGEERDTLKVVNDQFGAPTFTKNVVTNTFSLLEQNCKGYFHLSSSGITNWFEVANEIFRLKKMKVELLPVSSKEYVTKASRPFFSKLSTKKISTIPGIEIISWQQGLKELLNTI
ncbi:MAG: dTDP-4-dehydrorhamnose reductase [Balneola sp.]|nr:MAG: dTDP-4-dehydrorhamnose reductase [Balneola sp.]